MLAAIRAQNAQVSSGSIGDLPNLAGQEIAATVVVRGQLSSVEEFRPKLEKFYYDEKKYGSYLEQLGIKYPVVRK